jgi:hypothetical protein
MSDRATAPELALDLSEPDERVAPHRAPAVKNPYAKGTRQWKEFCDGEQRATRSVMDGEE